MVTAIKRKTKVALAVLGSMLALGVSLSAGPASAQAAITPYCGGWKGPWDWCAGAYRVLYQTYGWGEQAGVCVAPHHGWQVRCTTKANTGVYSDAWNEDMLGAPFISNNSNQNNFVHGLAGSH